MELVVSERGVLGALLKPAFGHLVALCADGKVARLVAVLQLNIEI